ncbi:hypothetical protein Golomagni_00719 [Golovinomyces magnicellulatus]|nr:hypothetical protein Golomagni_00719 [Golovinomyces magnicellulatus]
MADQIQEIMDIPREFVKDGSQFLNRCTKRMITIPLHPIMTHNLSTILTNCVVADLREFVKISQAVGIGFLIMGAVGYLVKLSQL